MNEPKDFIETPYGNGKSRETFEQNVGTYFSWAKRNVQSDDE